MHSQPRWTNLYNNKIRMKRNTLLFSIVLIFSVFCSIANVQAQEINFKTMKSSPGTMDKRLDGIYSWGAWVPESIDICVNLNTDSVYVDKQVYAILDHPKKWMIKKNMKFVSFACADENFNKVNVKLFQYDSGEFRVYVMEEHSAKKYTVKYLGGEAPKPTEKTQIKKK